VTPLAETLRTGDRIIIRAKGYPDNERQVVFLRLATMTKTSGVKVRAMYCRVDREGGGRGTDGEAKGSGYRFIWVPEKLLVRRATMNVSED
jgi:hypothetical protein